MGNSEKIRNHTAEPEIRFSCIGGSFMARLAMGALLVLTSSPNSVSASMSQRKTDMSYGQRDIGNESRLISDPTDIEVSDDIEGKCKKSFGEIEKISSETPLLIGFTDSLYDPDKIDKMVSLAEKYGADAELVRSILTKKERSGVDNKSLIEQAKRITKAWSDIIKEHYKNLTALYAIATDETSKANIMAKMEETREMASNLAVYEESLGRLMSHIKNPD